jgi:branched-chain amino acid transport system permease protein
MLLFLLVGGLGSLSGPLVGSLLVATLTQFLQQFQEYQLIVFGPLLVLVVIFFPQGIAGLLHRGETWFRNRGTGTDNGQSEEPAAEESRVEPTKEVR